MSIGKTRKQMLLNEEEFFTTPDMGEYLDNNLIIEAANKVANFETGGEFFIEAPFATAPGYYSTQNVIILSGKPSFATDDTEIGNTGRNRTDGDTIYLSFSEISDGGQLAPKISEKEQDNNKTIIEYLKQIVGECGLSQYKDLDTGEVSDKDQIGVRLLGINTPELPHFRTFENYEQNYDKWTCTYGDLIDANDENMITLKCGEKTTNIKKKYIQYMKYDPKYIEPKMRKRDDVLTFLKGTTVESNNDKTYDAAFELVNAPINNQYDGSESGTKQYDSNDLTLRVVLTHNEDDPKNEDDMEKFKQALAAQNDVFDMINKSEDVIYMLDQSYLANKKSGLVPYEYRKEWEKISQNPVYAFTSLWKNLTKEGPSRYSTMFKRFFGQEGNGRMLGAVYVKINTEYGSQWINLAKYLISKYDKIEVLPGYSDSDGVLSEYSNVSDAFKMWTYDKSKSIYVDAINNIDTDDRSTIQKQLTGIDLDVLTNHTVLLGDCLFMVPPTSIRVISQTKSERISMLRAKGTLTKTLPKTERLIEMQLYFNGDDAINGIPYEQITPSGQKLTFYMNGLRSLLAQFKFTPFLPIHNDYINYVLNIEAVSLANITINTVENFPRTLQVTITLQDFDYRQYMPEILPSDGDFKITAFSNMFSKVINWPVMRYYYQKCIKKGEELSDMDFSSDAYLKETVGQKTALQKVHFENPCFSLYIANEEKLKQRKMVKTSLENSPIESVIKFTDNETDFLKKLAIVGAAIQKAFLSYDVKNALERIAKPSDGSISAYVYGNESILDEDDYISEDKLNKLLTASGNSEYAKELDYNNGIVFVKKESDSIYSVQDDANKVRDKYIKPLTNIIISKVYEELREIEGYDESIIKGISVLYKADINDGATSKINPTPDNIDKDLSYVIFNIRVKVEINWDASNSDYMYDKITRYIAKANNVVSEKVFTNKSLCFDYKYEFKTFLKAKRNESDINTLANRITILSGCSNYARDTDNDDTNSLNVILNGFGVDIKDNNLVLGDNIFKTDNVIGDIKDNIDLESDSSISYDFYDIGYPIINNMSLSYGNVFNKMSMKIYDGYAAQYTGGSDTMIEINMTANDEYTVNQLHAISKICTQRLIDYRKIISNSPLRINSELTRFAGVNEVIIESVDINTIPNYPKKWSIVMRLSSVDRTLRNREALKKMKDIDNSRISNDAVIKTKNYFEINDALAKVELYPDLELPTIKELEQLGYAYIRYKTEGSRIFPDADFYFSYLHAFSSSILREQIVNYFNNSDNKQFYKEYGGNLLADDTVLSAVNLDGESNKITNEKIPSNYKSSYTIKEDNTATNNYSFNIFKVTDKEIEEVINNVSKSGSDSKYKQEADLNAVQKHNKEVKDAYNSLNESLECINYNSYNVNSDYKISIQDSLPYNNENTLLSETELDITVVDTDGTVETKKTNNIRKEYRDELITLIKDILSNPLSDDSSKCFADGTKNDNFIKALEYIFGIDKEHTEESDTRDSMGFPINSTNPTLSNYNLLSQSIFEGFARGATAIKSVWSSEDPDNDEDCKSRSYMSLYAEDDDEMKNVKLPFVFTAINGQGTNIKALAANEEDIKNAYIYGKFAIKKYDVSTIKSIYGIDIAAGTIGFLDPYYNKDLAKIILDQDVSDEEMDDRIKEYIRRITYCDDIPDGYCNGYDFNDYIVTEEDNAYKYSPEEAFFRIMLVWLLKYLQDGDLDNVGSDNNKRYSLLPDACYLVGILDQLIKKGKKADDNWIQNLIQSIKRKFNKNDLQSLTEKQNKLETGLNDEDRKKLEEAQKNEEAYEEESNYEEMLEDILEDLQSGLDDYKHKLFNGLFLTLGILALEDFNTPVYKAIQSGSIDTYVTYIETIKSYQLNNSDISATDNNIKTLIAYIDFKSNGDTNYNANNPDTYSGSKLDQYAYQGESKRLYLQCAEKPSIYMMHSFYDMVMTDMRGRMARAFPTYYMLLIDEGRELGYWRLQDNFYDVSSITEFQVVKSRKIAADTAKICMTNLFGTFTTEDEDIKDEYQYTFKDMWNSLFSPSKFISKEYERYTEARDINRAKLKAGARVNLRMGYSADASKLPILFNGVVTEVQEGDVMTIVCQGDGIELDNPDMFNPTDAQDTEDLKYTSQLIGSFLSTFDNSSTPRDILINPLMAEGTWIQNKIKNWSQGRFFNANPFGIVHFGDKKFKEIFTTNGEVEQNIYEGLATPTWANSDIAYNTTAYCYSLPTAPKVKVGIKENKSYWDLMHIAASISPDFIASIVPFQMRSSIFFGAPRYYYAYEYVKNTNGKIIEKRKPFQQYHVYTSYTDIIDNKISASEKDMRTVAVGLYQAPGVFESGKTKSVGPLYLDIDIYPEKQKTMTVNCNFEYRNTQLPFAIPIADDVMSEISKNGGYQIAWRATANALKDSVKDMYTGELIVMGDPSVKPYDKIYIQDLYEDINGSCDVESVVHTFSVETGFTTSITPDCTVAVDNKYEQIVNSTMKEMLAAAVETISTLAASNLFFSKITRGLFFALHSNLKETATLTESVINSAINAAGKDNISVLTRYSDKVSEAVGAGLGVTQTDIAIYNSINSIDDAYKAFKSIESISSSSTAVGFIDELLSIEKNLDNINPKSLEDSINALTKTSEEITEAKTSLNSLSKAYNSSRTSILNSINFDKEAIKSLTGSIPKETIAANAELKAAVESLDKLQDGIKYSKGAAATTKELQNLRTVVSHIDDFSEGSKALEALTSVNKNYLTAIKGLDEFSDIKNNLKGINMIRKGALSIKNILKTNLLWFVLDFAITKYTHEYIERKLKNLQVLTIFPLFKNGKVMTAGLDGNKGSVVGSVTYGQAGWLEQQCINFFNYKGNGAGGKMLAFLRDMFITTNEMIETVNGYRRDNNYAISTGSTDVVNQQEITNLLASLAKNTISGYNAYKQLYYDARINVDSDDSSVNSAYGQYTFQNMTKNDIMSSKKITSNLKSIYTLDLVNKLAYHNVFRFVGDKINNSQDSSDGSFNCSTDDLIMLPSVEGNDSEQTAIKTITRISSDGTNTYTPTYVLPYLRPEALIGFNYVLQKICATIQPDYENEECTFENLKQHNIILHNAVMINENSWMSTGYGFIIEVKDYNDFSKIVEEIDTVDTQLKEGSNKTFKLLYVKKDAYLSNNTYDFLIAPKEV